MSLMIPVVSEYTLSHTNQGERLVYRSLEKLDDDFVVFHSVDWNSKDNGVLKHGEGDFVVYVPNYGVIVLEVKSSEISFKNGKWFQKNRNSGVEHEISNPLHQADKTRYNLIKLFRESNINVSVISAIWFPSTNTILGTLPLDYNEELCFMERHLQNHKKALEKAFNFTGYSKHQYSKELRLKLIDLISPYFEIISTGQGLIDEYNHTLTRMTGEQTRILDYLVEQKEASIVGGAGTGKTILAVEKAKRLSSDGPVLFLCFNRFLAEDLRTRFESNNQVTVHNPYSLFWSFIKKNSVEFEDVNIEKLNEFLIEIDYSIWKYKHIIIDEGQDIDSTFILLLKELCNRDDSGYFYIFYDQNQAIQNSDEMSWRNGIHCQLVLNINCRNTKNIAKTSHSALNLNKMKIKSDIDGAVPRFFWSEDTGSLVETIGTNVREYLEAGFELDDITIITIKTIDQSVLNDISRVGSYRLSIDEKVGRSLLFTTARKFKGLESNIVIIVDIDSSTFSKDLESKLFYVASSRAKVKMDIHFVGDKAQLETLVSNRVGNDIKFKNLEFRKLMNIDLIS